MDRGNLKCPKCGFVNTHLTRMEIYLLRKGEFPNPVWCKGCGKEIQLNSSAMRLLKKVLFLPLLPLVAWGIVINYVEKKSPKDGEPGDWINAPLGYIAWVGTGIMWSLGVGITIVIFISFIPVVEAVWSFLGG